MAYREDKSTGDIIISGFEKGVADSPELGIGSIQSANITSVPGEVSVSFATASVPIPPVGITAASYTADSTADTLTVASTAEYYPGMAVTLQTTSSSSQINTLIVGGGSAGVGGTSQSNVGGGGGGKVVSQTNIPVAIGSYPIVVGAGGLSGGPGNNSTGFGFTATGGASGTTTTGGASGSGKTGGIGGLNGSSGYGGGGGGDSTSGQNGTDPAGVQTGGNGGPGTTSSISGTSVTYGDGGGGGAYSGNGALASVAGTGGSGNGGTGGFSTGGGVVAATAGVVNTGSGGGGAGGATVVSSGGAGGTGIVIISYPTGVITATGGTITTSGGNTIHTFTSPGTSNFTVSAVNPQAGKTYYVGNITPTTFKLYYDVNLSALVNILTNITGIYSIPSMTVPVWSAYERYYASSTSPAQLMTFILDNTGNCWYQPTVAVTGTGGTIAANSIQYTGNTGHATSGTGADFGLVVWHDYLFVIVGRTIDYVSISSLISAAGPAWVYAWKTNLTYTQYQHQTLAGLDDAVYICNAGTLASILEVPGQTFDPTNTATYVYNISALVLPYFDQAQSIAQLGQNLLIGGILTFVYPWDRISLEFAYPLICADSNIVRIVTTNSNAYVFAGSRGRIYICNGQQIQLYQEIPDALSGNPEPYYVWQDAIYLRNKLYFTFTDENNGGTALNSTGGIWTLGIDAGQTAIDVPTAGSLYNSNQFSYGTYGGSCPVLLQSLLNTPAGYGIGGAWVNNGMTGVDVPTSLPYTSFKTVIQTDIIPVGTFYKKQTDQQIEYKLAKPLVTGESLRISWRGNLASTFIPVWTSTAVGQVSDAHSVNFEQQQWVQLQVEMSSTATNPSYVRLTELRLR